MIPLNFLRTAAELLPILFAEDAKEADLKEAVSKSNAEEINKLMLDAAGNGLVFGDFDKKYVLKTPIEGGRAVSLLFWGTIRVLRSLFASSLRLLCTQLCTLLVRQPCS